jgi:hypothetical protein
MRKAQAAIHHLVHTACHDHFVVLICFFGSSTFKFGLDVTSIFWTFFLFAL